MNIVFSPNLSRGRVLEQVGARSVQNSRRAVREGGGVARRVDAVAAGLDAHQQDLNTREMEYMCI